MTRTRLPIYALLLLALLASVCSAQDPPIVVKVTADRADALYACGETAAFTVRVTRGEEAVTTGAVQCVLSQDGGATVAASEFAPGAEPTVVEGTLEAPGVLQCTCTWREGDAAAQGRGAAAFDPEGIEAATPEPEDFDAFWTAQKALLDEVPVDAQIVETPEASTGTYTVYRISLANVDGARVYGWLGVPKRDGPHPAMLQVPGAGVYPIGPGAVGMAGDGFLAIAISVHNYEIDTPKERCDELNANELAGYPHQGRESRDTYYFRRVFLGCVRVIDYLTSRDDWDGKTMIVTGSSQGGALSIVTAGLDPRVTGAAANVPALCDFYAKYVGRSPGWPRPIREDTDAEKATVPYFDAVNFAKRISCPVIVGIGLVDTTCPPAGIYSMCNELGGSVEIVMTPDMAHSQSEEYGARRYEWLLEQAGLRAP